MFDMNELLSKKNQRIAMAFLGEKKDGCGRDGIRVSDFKEYWDINHERIETELRNVTYTPGVIMTHEIINAHGKRRIVSMLNTTDRYITRLLAQKLRRYVEPLFLPDSFAYQENKGTLQAVMRIKEYAEAGNEILVEVDLKNYFDSVPLDRMHQMISNNIRDQSVSLLIKSYLFCQLEMDDRILGKEVGLVQGNSISPILSNWYLHSLDVYMTEQGWNWIRFADNIYICAKTNSKAINIYNNLCEKIKTEYQLDINDNKSGIHDLYQQTILGYNLSRTKTGIDVKKKQYEKKEVYSNWNYSVVQKINKDYHIVQDGILCKKDYSMLFENDDCKHHIPVEIVDTLNIYGNITLSSNVLATLSSKKIGVSIFDKFGNLMGRYYPEGYGCHSAALLKQCELYSLPEKRLEMAKKMEIAGIHNMRSNLKYYHKKNGGLEQYIATLGDEITAINEGKSVDALLLIEARARQLYYSAFNHIIKTKGFRFEKRTKRPPADAINAMISFGNTLLYNQVLQMIWKTPLDPRIGVVHATNRRAHSLNLDFADIFKPIITDRVIFSLVNLKQINANKHFEKNESGGVYMTKEGKRIFLEEFMEKMNSKIIVQNESISYKQLIMREIRNYQNHVMHEKKYKPYKYY